MVNGDDIERVIAGLLKKKFVEFVRLNPDCQRADLRKHLYGDDRHVEDKIITVHMCQINRVLRLHKYEIRSGGRGNQHLRNQYYFPTYRLVKLESPR